MSVHCCSGCLLSYGKLATSLHTVHSLAMHRHSHVASICHRCLHMTITTAYCIIICRYMAWNWQRPISCIIPSSSRCIGKAVVSNYEGMQLLHMLQSMIEAAVGLLIVLNEITEIALHRLHMSAFRGSLLCDGTVDCSTMEILNQCWLENQT